MAGYEVYQDIFSIASMGFEVVMVLATAWMLSAAYVTLHKRHIGITFFIYGL